MLKAYRSLSATGKRTILNLTEDTAAIYPRHLRPNLHVVGRQHD